MQYYHVAHPDYETGDDLLCPEFLETERGIVHAWKWEPGQEDLDRDMVCLFRDRTDAEAFRAAFAPAGRLLCIDIPEEAIECRSIRMVVNGEGFDGVLGRIPGAYISEG